MRLRRALNRMRRNTPRWFSPTRSPSSGNRQSCRTSTWSRVRRAVHRVGGTPWGKRPICRSLQERTAAKRTVSLRLLPADPSRRLPAAGISTQWWTMTISNSMRPAPAVLRANQARRLKRGIGGSSPARHRIHGDKSRSAGGVSKRTSTRKPPSVESSSMTPAPWRAAMLATMARPSPLPVPSPALRWPR